ncbi:MAG: PQQ-binding-like beta-propeller repeat protein, partial [Armatimonadota bacterium]
LGGDERGVVHRDLKPHNVLVDRKRTAKITDFGLVKVFGVDTRLTPTATGMGSYLYMAPEQFTDAASVGKPADIYSFGVVLYQALTGRLPIMGDSVANLIHNIVKVEPQAPSSVNLDVPEDLGELVMGCLRKSPSERCQSFGELGRDLAEIAAQLKDQAAFAAVGKACQQCGYRTRTGREECLVCEGPLVAAARVVAVELEPPPTEEAPAVEPEPAREEPAPAVEERPDPEAAARRFQAGAAHFKAGRLKEARLELRRALQHDPGHVEAAQGLEEVLARLREERDQRRAAIQPLDWPMFRGNPARNGYTPEILTPPLVEKWQAEVGEWTWASPAVAGGYVYVGARVNVGSNYGRLCCLDAATGRLVWERLTGYEVNAPPLVLGQLLLAGFAGALSAFHAGTGEAGWQVRTGRAVSGGAAALGDSIYFGSADNQLHAVELRSGRKQWTFSTGGAIYASPTAWGDAVYFGSADHFVYAVRAANGTLLWKLETGDEVLSSAALLGDVLFIGSTDGSVYAIDRRQGKLIWRYETRDQVYSSPALYRNRVYIGSRDHHVYALDGETGQPLWRFETGDWVYASPAIADDVVYIGSYDRRLYALDADTGEKLWETQTTGEIRSSPAVARGCLYVGTNDGKVYAYQQGSA